MFLVPTYQVHHKKGRGGKGIEEEGREGKERELKGGRELKGREENRREGKGRNKVYLLDNMIDYNWIRWH